MGKLTDLANTASQIVAFVAPVIRLTQAGSPIALKLADALEVATGWLKFGAKLEAEHLAELEADLKAIKAEVEEMAKQGEHVPTEKWDDVHHNITDAAARVRKALGLPAA